MPSSETASSEPHSVSRNRLAPALARVGAFALLSRSPEDRDVGFSLAFAALRPDGSVFSSDGAPSSAVSFSFGLERLP